MRTKIMINGLPGNVAQVITEEALSDKRLEVVPFSLTGADIEIEHCHIADRVIKLIRPEVRAEKMAAVIEKQGPMISIDFTHPSAVNSNAAFYCRSNLPFVMGTTGGNRDKLRRTVLESPIAAVIAPNMAKQIVGFQAMMAHAAEHFPNLFEGYRLTVRESHQAGKADTSGTARAMVGYFNAMGIDFNVEQIEKERDPERQRGMWGIPAEYLGGHGWHTYTLSSPDKSVKFEFMHNINGRRIYAQGTFDAALYLARKRAQGAQGKVYSMIDVLKASA